MDNIGKSFTSFGKNIQSSFKPWVARTGQYAREQLGQAGDKTELPADYLELEARVDALKQVHQKMLQVTSQYTNEAYDYPSNLRESFNDLGRTVSEKVSLLSSATSPSEAAAAMTAPPASRPQPKTFSHAIARAALNSSQLLAQQPASSSAAAAAADASTTAGATAAAGGTTTGSTGAIGGGGGGVEASLAQALEKYAIASEKVGEARLQQDSAIQARYLAGWNTTLNTNLQFAARARKSVENARLNLDAVKGRVRGSQQQKTAGGAAAGGGMGLDEASLTEEQRAEIEAAEDDFVGQTEEAVGVMKNVLDTPEPLRNLAELIAAQLEYHKRAYEILSELAPAVDQLQVEQEANYRKSREGTA